MHVGIHSDTVYNTEDAFLFTTVSTQQIRQLNLSMQLGRATFITKLSLLQKSPDFTSVWFQFFFHKWEGSQSRCNRMKLQILMIKLWHFSIVSDESFSSPWRLLCVIETQLKEKLGTESKYIKFQFSTLKSKILFLLLGCVSFFSLNYFICTK